MSTNITVGIVVFAALLLLFAVRYGFRGLVIQIGE